MKKFEKGDLVKLKSGGPIMTVSENAKWNAFKGGIGGKGGYDEEQICCNWFVKDEKRSKWFNIETLEPA